MQNGFSHIRDSWHFFKEMAGVGAIPENVSESRFSRPVPEYS